jgi:hypothetical protein
MKHLKLFMLCILFIGGYKAIAQDKIYKKNGEIIDAKIKQISTESITFKRWENLEGPEYVIAKGDVYKIKWANGTQDIYEENNDKLGADEKGRPRHNEYKNANILAFAPIQFTENGYGFGFTYEHVLDKRGWVSFYIPAILTFSNSQTSDAYGNSTNHNFSNPLFYIMPGVKLYTNLNSDHRAKFSINPALVFATGNRTYQNYDYYTGGSFNNTTVTKTMMGAIVNFGENLLVSEHVYLGYDAGFGISYINDENGQAQSTSGFFQASLRIGYRYMKGTKK